MFQVANLSFSFKQDDPVIFENITFDLPNKKCVGLLGDNGSGKSTLAHILTGVIPEIYSGFLRGSFTCEGMDLLQFPLQERLKRISYTFQDTESQILFGTVSDIVGLNEKEAHTELILEAVDLLGIHHLLARRSDQLSGGEEQKVILTSSLRQNPSLLIYDEATSALDLFTKRNFRHLVASLLSKDKTIFLLGQKYQLLADLVTEAYKLTNTRVLRYEDALKLGVELRDQNSKMQFWQEMNLKPAHPPSFTLSELRFSPERQSQFSLNVKDLKIERGKNIALVGKNGAGKSTLMYALCGFIKPKKIEIEPTIHSLTKIVFQSPTSQIVTGSVKEELDPFNSFSVSQQMLILDHFPFLAFERDPFDLSFGQQRILCLLSAFLSKKSILLIDEPEMGIDQNNLGYVKAFLLRNKVAQEKTVIFSTHDFELASECADEVILIDSGEITSIWNPKCKDDLETWFVRSLSA